MSDEKQPQVTRLTPIESVPVFSCVIHVRKLDGGTIVGRVANLDGFECESASERDVLASLSKQFKAHVAKLHENGETPELIDPPLAPKPGEQTRFIPVHL